MANIQTPPLIRGDFKVEIEGMLSWLPSDRAAKLPNSEEPTKDMVLQVKHI